MLDKEKLLAEIIVQNPTASAVTISDVIFSNPIPYTDTLAEPELQRNTLITVSAANGSPFSDSVQLYYNRISLEELMPIDIQIEAGDVISPAELIALINVEKGTELSLLDLNQVDVPVLDEIGDAALAVLTANNLSIGWTDTGYLVINNLPDNVNDLNTFVLETLPSTGYLI